MSYRRVQYCVSCNISCGKMRFSCPKCSGQLRYVSVCRKCNLPKNPLTSTAKNLKLFHTLEYGEFGATDQNKLNYAFDRALTFCNEETCARYVSPKSQDFLDLMHSVLGPAPSKNAIKKWKRDPNYRPEVRV